MEKKYIHIQYTYKHTQEISLYHSKSVHKLGFIYIHTHTHTHKGKQKN